MSRVYMYIYILAPTELDLISLVPNSQKLLLVSESCWKGSIACIRTVTDVIARNTHSPAQSGHQNPRSGYLRTYQDVRPQSDQNTLMDCHLYL